MILTSAIVCLLLATISTCCATSISTPLKTRQTNDSKQVQPDSRINRKEDLLHSHWSVTREYTQGATTRIRRTTIKQQSRKQQQSGSKQSTWSPPTSDDQQQQQQQIGAPARAIKNVTAQNGQSILLHCLVEPTGGDLVQSTSVSWFRGTNELQLLTVETSTIIQDERFVVRHGLLKDNDWALQIKDLDRTDAGLYQCQTSEDPPQSQYYQLNVVEPQVHIAGAPDLAVKLGSAINLTCVISQAAEQLQFVFWYRDDRMINYDIANEQRGKVVIAKSVLKQDVITSNLLIFQSRLSDSGNYTCQPSGARPTSIYVHILEDNDKRLIMFQNDYSPAASSRQTNSAISTHLTRLSSGRSYALLIGLIILVSWIQSIAQIQTGISLILLAIIGIFISETTRHSEQVPDGGSSHRIKYTQIECPADRTNKNERTKKTESNVAGTNQLGSLLTPVDAEKPSGKDDDEPEEGDNEDSSELESEVSLLRRANSAINMLKTLTSSFESGSSSIEDLDDKQNKLERDAGRANSKSNTCDRMQDSLRCLDESYKFFSRDPSRNKTERAVIATGHSKPLTSPSSSSASTGYNSDSTTVKNRSHHQGSHSTNSPLLDNFEMDEVEVLRLTPPKVPQTNEHANEASTHISTVSRCQGEHCDLKTKPRDLLEAVIRHSSRSAKEQVARGHDGGRLLSRSL